VKNPLRYSRFSAALAVAVFAGACDRPSSVEPPQPEQPRASVTDLQTTYWVDGVNGNDANPGTTASLAWQTLGKAASVVQAGDVVTVRDGSYYGPSGGRVVQITASGTPGNLIVFRSENPSGAVIDGQNNAGAATGVDIRGNYIRIEGFEIKGMAHNGFNIQGSSGTPLLGIEVAQNHIHDVGRLCRAADYGLQGSGLSAFSVTNASALIERNTIHDIGRYGPGEQGCVPPDDHYQNHDHGVYVSEGASGTIIRNNQFYKIEHGWGVHLYNGAGTSVNAVYIANNTFADPNPWRDGHIIVAVPVTNSTIANNIFYQPTNAAIRFSGSFAHSLAVTNNVMTGQVAVNDGSPTGVTYSGNKPNSDPQALFTNPGARDYTLKSGTNPAVDAGVTLSYVSNDFLGVMRPIGAAYDAGAYESGSPPPPPPSTYYYARPNGIASGAGDINNPWSLGWALSSSNTTLQPGDTVWLLPGTYGDSTFTATKGGTTASPIVYRQHSSGRATINGRLKVSSSAHDLWFWGFEVTQLTRHDGWYGIESYAPAIKYINLVIHDVNKSGMIINWPSGSTEVYGSIMYNNGSADHPNLDHGIYVQGTSPNTQQIEQNVFFNNLAYGVHSYGGPSDPALGGVNVRDNVSFNNGTICTGCGYAAKGNIFVGDERGGASNIQIIENFVYHKRTTAGTGIEAGYTSTGSNVTVSYNRIFGGETGLKVDSWTTGLVEQNTIGGGGRYAVFLADASPSGFTWRGNGLFHTATDLGWYWSGDRTFDGWRSATGLGSGTVPDVINGPTGDWWSTFSYMMPANKFEHGRGLFVVFNESGFSSVNVSLASYLNANETYKIFNVFDLTTPVASGTYGGGTVSVPLGTMGPQAPTTQTAVSKAVSIGGDANALSANSNAVSQGNDRE